MDDNNHGSSGQGVLPVLRSMYTILDLKRQGNEKEQNGIVSGMASGVIILARSDRKAKTLAILKENRNTNVVAAIESTEKSKQAAAKELNEEAKDLASQVLNCFRSASELLNLLFHPIDALEKIIVRDIEKGACIILLIRDAGCIILVLDEEEYLQLQEGEWEVEVDEAALVGGEEAAEAAAMVDAGVLAADDPLAID
ncbi:hypothetical protein ACET3Z_016920 [Daucus carota]